MQSEHECYVTKFRLTDLCNNAWFLRVDVVFNDVIDEPVLLLGLHHARATGTCLLNGLLNVDLTLEA